MLGAGGPDLIGLLLHWWRCPRTVKAAVDRWEQSLQSWATPALRQALANDFDKLPSWVPVTQLRLIAYAYGLARTVTNEPGSDEDFVPGWNRRLIEDGGGNAKKTTREIFRQVHQRLRESTPRP
jgi:hypothetical protein